MVKVHPGADGLIRNVTVKTATSTLVRPVQKLHRLELPVSAEVPECPDLEEDSAAVQVEQGRESPQQTSEMQPHETAVPVEVRGTRATRSGRVVTAPTKLDL